MKNFIIGIDVGGTTIKFALFKRGKIIFRDLLRTKGLRNSSALIDAIVEKVQWICAQNGLRISSLAGIGIGLPGMVNYKSGVVHRLTNIPGWKNVGLKNILQRRLGIKAQIDNDVNLMGLGEVIFGAGRGFKNVVCMTLGTGVGGALIIDGELYRGSTSSAGEIGHIPINEYGPKCNCGGSGCLEKYVGNKAIVDEALRHIKKGRRTLITKLTGNNVSLITPKIITDASRRGDKFSLQVWTNIGIHIGIALAGVANVFNPDAVVIGGGVSKAGRALFDSIRATIKRRAMSPAKDNIKIIKSELGDDAGVFGAMQLIRGEK